MMADIYEAFVSCIEPRNERTADSIDNIDIWYPQQNENQPSFPFAWKAEQEGNVEYIKVECIARVSNADDTLPVHKHK
jgi:hypothetical protein